jgi:hypothetical protein
MGVITESHALQLCLMSRYRVRVEIGPIPVRMGTVKHAASTSRLGRTVPTHRCLDLSCRGRMRASTSRRGHSKEPKSRHGVVELGGNPIGMASDNHFSRFVAGLFNHIGACTSRVKVPPSRISFGGVGAKLRFYLGYSVGALHL